MCKSVPSIKKEGVFLKGFTIKSMWKCNENTKLIKGEKLNE